MQGIYLPSELACRLIELEVNMQDQQGLNRDSILQLLDCYTRAVQFYNEKGDDRRNVYYQRKMQDFLQKPAITEVLQQGKKSDLTLRKERTEEEMRKANNQSQQIVKQLVQHSKEESAKQKLFLEAHLAKQQKTLEERIERKRANSNRIARPKLPSSSFVCSTNREPDLIPGFVEVKQPTKKQEKEAGSKKE